MKTIECDCGYMLVVFKDKCDEENVKAFKWYCEECGRKLYASEMKIEDDDVGRELELLADVKKAFPNILEQVKKGRFKYK